MSYGRAHAPDPRPDGLWRLRAECRPGNGHDPETWFPRPLPAASASSLQRRIAALRYQEQVERAKAECRRCPVAAECLNYALRNGEKEGIWGGLTPEERENL